MIYKQCFKTAESLPRFKPSMFIMFIAVIGDSIMAKFVKSSRVNSNVVPDAAPVANVGLGSMPAGLGSMPANLGATPVAPVANVEPVAPVANVAPRSRFGRTASTAAPKSTAPAQSPAPVQSPVQPALSMSDIMEAMNILINQEVAKVYEKIHCMTREIKDLNIKIDTHTDNVFSEATKDIYSRIGEIELRVKDIEDYLSGEGEGEECGDSDLPPDSNPTNLTFVDADDEPVNAADEPVNEDELSLDDIDPEKVLAFLRKEPNVSVNVIRSVRNALGRKQFAISSIKNDDEAFCECLEALDSMGIDLEQFTND